MVRAILDGRKTQTRRIIKPQPPDDGWSFNQSLVENLDKGAMEFHDDSRHSAMCPYGLSADRLWVRESWARVAAEPSTIYRADYCTGLEKRDGDQKWKPSIHMKRADSRINLEITDIRVERLQNISEKDAIAEGIEPVRSIWKLYSERVLGSADATGQPRKSYASLWQSINGPGSWAANPWVWVVEFRKI